ncbi:MAG: hypothetical protein PHD48_05815 [Alphaproteobacteria bacterium]|nr:hypothetical protein [Alphaproteobacteria bacterium]
MNNNAPAIKCLEVKSLSELPQPPDGYRYFDFIGGSKGLKCFLVPKDTPRGKFMNDIEPQLDECLMPIYKKNGICVRQDASFALPGFYIVNPIEHYRSMDEIGEVDNLRLALIVREIRKGMREALGIKHIHMYYEEKANKACNVHYWLMPIVDIVKYPTIAHVRPMEYLKQFSIADHRETILEYNEKMRSYIRDTHLAEKDEDLVRRMETPARHLSARKSRTHELGCK